MRSSKPVTQRRSKTSRVASFARRPIGHAKEATQPRAKTNRDASFAMPPTGRAQPQLGETIRQGSDDTVIQATSEAIQAMAFALDDAVAAISYHLYDTEPEKSVGPLARARKHLTYAIEMIDEAIRIDRSA